MKIYYVVFALILTGCSTTKVPVKIDNPFEFPQSLLEECREPEYLNPEMKLSENLKIMIENNTKFTECRVTKKALNELIKLRKESFDRNVK